METMTESQTSGATFEEGHDDQLIPGIPNEIALDRILTKLSWKDIRLSASVSRAWFHAIRTRRVYDARVRTQTTEPFAVANDHPEDDVHAVFLHSWPDGNGLQPPPLRSEYFEYETEPSGRCVTLDGKVYVFGGLDRKVHVLDVAGQGLWTQCASTHKARQEFGSGAIDGKVYVFGGAINHEATSGFKLVDPSGETRSVFRPIKSLRCGHHISRIRKDLFVTGHFGYFLYGEPRKCVENDRGCYFVTAPKKHLHVEDADHLRDADLLEVYDPTKDEWTVVEPMGSAKEKLFIAGGKFYSMSPVGIHQYDFRRNSWAQLHSFSFAAITPVDSVELWPVGMFTDEKELFAVLDWPSADGRTISSCLVQSKGLGGQRQELEWKISQFPVPFDYWSSQPTVYLVHSLNL